VLKAAVMAQLCFVVELQPYAKTAWSSKSSTAALASAWIHSPAKHLILAATMTLIATMVSADGQKTTRLASAKISQKKVSPVKDS
jgi:hypothetical protein